MAHMIATNRLTGKASISFRGETPWHGLGTKLTCNDATTWAKEAGLDWLAVKGPAYSLREATIEDGFGMPMTALLKEELEDVRVVRRSDTGDILSTVGKNTHLLQNSEAFAFFQPFLDAGHANLETAMALNDGRRIVVTAKVNLPNAEIVKGDEVAAYMALAHSHDNSLAVHVGFTPTRIVCANTLRAARDNEKSKLIRVRHGRDVVQRVNDIRETMDAVKGTFEASAEQYRALASRRNINQKDLRNYVKTVFKMEENAEGKLATRTQNTLDDILRLHDSRTGIVSEMLTQIKQREEQERGDHAVIGAALFDAVLSGFEAGKGTDIPDARNSWWTAYNAVTEYLTHTRGRSAENRINSGLFGPNAETNQLALDTAMAMSGLVSA